jgi:hypothetical protein
MSRVSKRPSLVVSDDNRVPVPGLVQDSAHLARYEITPLGHVYRDDGRLLTPTPGGKINFNGGTVSRSLSTLVFRAFGRPELVAMWRADQRNVLVGEVIHDLWVDPCGPTDKLTGRRRCTVHDVFLVPHGEVITRGRYGRAPATKLPIV